MKLSILIPSTKDRYIMTEELVKILRNQANGYPVDVITLYDMREMPIGVKRQKMLEEATSEYVCFFDSDDLPSDNYVSEIMSALNENPDSVGFKIRCEGTKFKYGIASNRFSDWKTVDGVYQRTPYQKTPIKREIALQIGYPPDRYGEDYIYSIRLKKSGLIKSEVFIDDFLYIYRYTYQDPKLKYGIERKASNNKRKHR